jgi:hypothetical protein
MITGDHSTSIHPGHARIGVNDNTGVGTPSRNPTMDDHNSNQQIRTNHITEIVLDVRRGILTFKLVDSSTYGKKKHVDFALHPIQLESTTSFFPSLTSISSSQLQSSQQWVPRGGDPTYIIWNDHKRPFHWHPSRSCPNRRQRQHRSWHPPQGTQQWMITTQTSRLVGQNHMTEIDLDVRGGIRTLVRNQKSC